MRNKSRLLSLFMALVLICSTLAAFVSTASALDVTEDFTGKLVIIHTNDVHGRDVATSASYGTAAVAQLKKDLEAKGAEVLLLSAGDAIQGLPLVNLDQGASAIEFMAAAGYDAMAPGNHEFDWGVRNLLDILSANATFPVLSANIKYTAGNPYNKPAGSLVFDANEIFDFGSGMKVGVFGLTTPESATKAHPDKVQGVEFLAGSAMFAVAQAQVDYLKAQGCDLIVCVGHLGIDVESTGNRSTDLIAAVDGIDLFVDGHSHTTLLTGELVPDKGSNDTLLVSAGTQLAAIGVVVYDPGTPSLDAELLRIISNVKQYAGIDSTLNNTINTRNDAVDSALSGKIGETEVLLYGLNTTTPPGVRMSETNLGDFAADALLWKAQQALGTGTTVDAAITNGGGIRASIPIGDITMKDMVSVFPFGNQVATVAITGTQLLEALEAATFCTPTVIGAFPQVSGIEFTIHTYVPYVNGPIYSGSTYYSPARPGARIQDVKVGGQPLDLTKTYVIATNDFTAAGGDTYSVFKKTSKFTNTGVAMEDALIDYLDEIGGVVTSQAYAQPKGRITVYTVDAFAPTVSSITPSGASAALNGNIVITFGETMDTAFGTVSLNGTVLTGGTWSNYDTTYTIPYTGLAYGAACTVDIEGFKDLAGNEMTAASRSFTAMSRGSSSSGDTSSYRITSNNESASYSGVRGGNLVFVINGDVNKLRSVSVDGQLLTQGTHYKVESGSTIVTIFESYLSTLSEGNHSVAFLYTDGSAHATINVQAAYVPEAIAIDPPKTGDGTQMAGWWLLSGACIALAACMALKRKLAAK